MDLGQPEHDTNAQWPVATFEEFEELCLDYVGFWRSEILERVDAVDCIQRHAELWGVVDAFGQDKVQAAMAAAFAPAPEIPSGYAYQLVRGWELADSRDRHRWTGEMPPASQPAPEWPPRRPYATPQSAIDAFFVVHGTGDANRLSNWLTAHPRDVSTLHKLWRAKCSIAA